MAYNYFALPRQIIFLLNELYFHISLTMLRV